MSFCPHFACPDSVRNFRKSAVRCLCVRLDKDKTDLSGLSVSLSADVWCAVTLFNFRDNFPSSFKLSNFCQIFPTATKLSNFSDIFQLRKNFSNFTQFFPTSLSSLQFRLALSNSNKNFQLGTFQLKTVQLLFFQLPFPTTRIPEKSFENIFCRNGVTEKLQNR